MATARELALPPGAVMDAHAHGRKRVPETLEPVGCRAGVVAAERYGRPAPAMTTGPACSKEAGPVVVERQDQRLRIEAEVLSCADVASAG